MLNYPQPENWHYATPRQADRAARSFAELAKHAVPVYPGPLMVEDDAEALIQESQQVARRTLCLWAVVLRAEGTPKLEAFEILNIQGIRESLSPSEQRFLENDRPEADECTRLVWRLESIWVFLWALGFVDELGWPNRMCDVPKLGEIVATFESNPDFFSNALLRPKSKLLDAQDLTMRIHWAIRNARSTTGAVSEDLDWTGNSDLFPVDQCPAVRVVEQRHYALNWLVCAGGNSAWDDVDTPT